MPLRIVTLWPKYHTNALDKGITEGTEEKDDIQRRNINEGMR